MIDKCSEFVASIIDINNLSDTMIIDYVQKEIVNGNVCLICDEKYKQKFKNYFNLAALSSIPITLLFFILEWNDFFVKLGIMDLYWCVFAIYYFIVLFIVNKTARVKI